MLFCFSETCLSTILLFYEKVKIFFRAGCLFSETWGEVYTKPVSRDMMSGRK